MKLYKIIALLGVTISLAGCYDMNYYYPPHPHVYNPPAASGMHYGPPAPPPTPAAAGMHYGPPPAPPAPVYPTVTVTNPPADADGMHYGP